MGLVALLTEGVDRNTAACVDLIGQVIVALLTEGVDRNNAESVAEGIANLSPSSRRAWIEIRKSLARSRSADSRPPHGGRG